MHEQESCSTPGAYWGKADGVVVTPVPIYRCTITLWMSLPFGVLCFDKECFTAAIIQGFARLYVRSA